MKRSHILTRFLLGLLLLVGVGLAGEQFARWQARRTLPLPGRWVRVGDHRLHVRTYGTGGPVVVFESGLDTGGSLAWEPVARQVAPFATAVTYDRAGLLGSERGTQPKTSTAMAQDLHTLLHRAGYADPYLLVGHPVPASCQAFIERSVIIDVLAFYQPSFLDRPCATLQSRLSTWYGHHLVCPRER